MKKTIAALALLPALAACTTTNTVPIAPDTFRLDTEAAGYLFTGRAGEDTLLKAAQITQQHGYTHFVVLNGDSATGSQYAGTSVGHIGSTWFASPSYAPTQNVSIIVKMTNASSEGAWNVADVIANKGKMF